MKLSKIDTPCIGVCSTVYGDMVCRGCKRYYNEVIDWNTYSDQQKQTILSRLEQDIVAVVTKKLSVDDVKLLQQQMQKFNIRYWEGQNALCLAYYLLRDAHQNIKNINKYGIVIKPSFTHLNFSQLYEIVEHELLIRSEQAIL